MSKIDFEVWSYPEMTASTFLVHVDSRIKNLMLLSEKVMNSIHRHQAMVFTPLVYVNSSSTHADDLKQQDSRESYVLQDIVVK